MEERYEIKGKIGQGGLGAVYRAQDLRMNREVAIKRIITSSDDTNLPAEATRQLQQEAGILASLQHPNIVTVYDVGSDEDGLFLVMELLTGDTIEDLIVEASFTWTDFRQLAKQTMEALIAAQELGMVHRDLKPSNIMLTWLPSGKFQVKIVDFGLSKLSPQPSMQTIDQSDGVFGSIYFMAPEQFERVPIDLKADLYAIGCVYYYALTGTYPFESDTAAGVMAAHLQHQVTPLHEVREGIPMWVCDWVMWHINRQPSDRPASARESLRVFLENDQQASPPLSTGCPAAAAGQPKRPRLMIPGASPVSETLGAPAVSQPQKTASMSRPLAPPVGYKPSVHTTAQVLESAPLAGEAPKPQETPAAQNNAAPVAKLASSILKRAAVPVEVPEPQIAPTAKLAPTSNLSPTAILKPALVPTERLSNGSTTRKATLAPKKKKLSSAQQTMIAAVLGILVVILTVYLIKRSGQSAEAKLYNEMIAQAIKPDATEVPVTNRKLELLLRSATHVGVNEQRDAIYMALHLAKSTDDTDVDARIAEFATTQEMIPNIRIVLLRDVLRKRKNPAIIGNLMKFALSTKDVPIAEAAIQATRFMADDSHLAQMLDIIKTSNENSLIIAAEGNAAEIIKKSTAKPALFSQVSAVYESASSELIRHTMLRLLGHIGCDQSLAIVKKSLDSPEVPNQIAAIVALGTWGDRSGYDALIDFLQTATDLGIRTRAFNAAYDYVFQTKTELKENWSLLAEQAKTKNEQLKVIRGLVNLKPEPWVYAIIQKFADIKKHDDVTELAERAIEKLKDIESIQSGAKEEE